MQNIIEKFDKEFSEKFVLDENRDPKSHKKLGTMGYSIGAVPARDIQSHFHQLLLSIAKGECERLRGVRKGKEDGEDEMWAAHYQGYDEAISDSLENWKEIISYLEKK